MPPSAIFSVSQTPNKVIFLASVPSPLDLLASRGEQSELGLSNRSGEPVQEPCCSCLASPDQGILEDKAPSNCWDHCGPEVFLSSFPEVALIALALGS